ncbi:MAG: outer membrane protein assembly factor BamA [Hyphomicrobiales bacterium]|nr:outer membrane protein assembly factor BamA [Hyphomicrobiales bacterium]
MALCAAVLLGIAPIGPLGPTEAHAQGGVIRDIRVVGNKRVEPETIKTYLTLSVGERYDASKAEESFQALFATGLFQDVRINLSGNVVVVTVVESPVVNRVAFEGNKEIKDDVLLAEIQLKERQIFTRARVQSDVQRILNVYQRSGYYAVAVEPKIIELDHNRVNLVFEIKEGPDTKVYSINFIGNEAFSDSQLRDAVSTSESAWWKFLSTTDVFDSDRLNLDRELLRRFYLKSGYADARVVAANADLDRDGKGFFITFTVEEGELYRFGSVNIESSLAAVDPASLRGDLLIKEGQIYDAEAIDKTTERLTIAVANQGYAFGMVRPRIERDPVSRLISVNYVVEQGPRVYIERINVVGNYRTLDYVIRREFRLAEGDAYNRLMVDQARQRLVGLGFFKSVKVNRENGSAPDRVVLTIELEENSTGELAFAAGYSSNEGIIGEVSYTERNLLGKGQYLKIKLSGSLESAQFDISFTEPRFLDRNISAGFDAFHKELDYTDEAGYMNRKTGGGPRIGFALAEYVWLNTSYTFTRDETYDLEDNASLAVRDIEGVAHISTVGYSLVYDTRNSKMNPTKGLYLIFGQDLAGVGGDVNFIRSTAEARGYYPLFKGVTLVGRATAGYIEGWGGDDVRLVDAFYKGGETIRGFDTAGIGPRDDVTNDALGGKAFYAGTVEVRFPIPFLPDELGFGGAVFADAGSVFDTDVQDTCGGPDPVCVQDNSGLRSSVGASLLWNSPVGPLRADFAYALSKEKFDETEPFRFGASTKF